MISWQTVRLNAPRISPSTEATMELTIDRVNIFGTLKSNNNNKKHCNNQCYLSKLNFKKVFKNVQLPEGCKVKKEATKFCHLRLSHWLITEILLEQKLQWPYMTSVCKKRFRKVIKEMNDYIPGKEEKPHFQSYHIIKFKMSVFKKITLHAKK